jgi:uncharacterized protein YcfL
MRVRTSIPRVVFLLGLLLAGLLLVGACRSGQGAGDLPSGGVERENAIGERLVQRDPRVVQDGDARCLEVTIANPSSDRITSRCAPEWYDAKGAVVSAPRDWQEVDLAPKAERRMRFAPMPAAARSWRLRFES